MSKKMKRRLIAVSGIVIIVLVIALVVIGGSTSARTVDIAEAVDNPTVGEKIQVSGNVAEDSYSFSGDTLTFSIYDPDSDNSQQLVVRYEGAASSTFGNDVTAICTGRIAEDGALDCSELVTKCPSKYEDSDSALEVSQLIGYGEEIYGKTMKVVGVVAQGSLQPAGGDRRFVLNDSSIGAAADGAESVPVIFDGALSDDIGDGSTVVVTGALSADGSVDATDVALSAGGENA